MLNDTSEYKPHRDLANILSKHYRYRYLSQRQTHSHPDKSSQAQDETTTDYLESQVNNNDDFNHISDKYSSAVHLDDQSYQFQLLQADIAQTSQSNLVHTCAVWTKQKVSPSAAIGQSPGGGMKEFNAKPTTMGAFPSPVVRSSKRLVSTHHSTDHTMHSPPRSEKVLNQDNNYIL